MRRDCQHPRARHEHGTYLAHKRDGCRCQPCVQAARRQAKLTDYRTQTQTHTYVDAEPARAHVRDIMRTLSVGQIEQRSGVHRTAIRVLVGDFPGRPASRRITRETERRLLAVTPDRVGPELSGWVDATGTQRRLQALVALGWPLAVLGRRIGMTSANTHAMLRRNPVRASTAAKVRALYDELSTQVPEPRRHVTRARKLAAARGWVPPLAWDDDMIDNPQARPNLGVKRAREHVNDEVAIMRVMHGDRELAKLLHPAERREIVRRLTRAGLNDQQIERRTGISARTAIRHRHAPTEEASA